nr:hypothetical protein [Tanacetum cinerariifolium]
MVGGLEDKGVTFTNTSSSSA